MKIIKYLFFLLLILAIGFSIYVAIQPSEYNIKRTRVIEAPAEVVFNNINNFKNWEAWGPWKEEDPSMAFTYGDKTEGEGANYKWTGKEGAGAMTTDAVFANDSIHQQISFDGADPAEVYWKFKPAGEGTEVTWGMKGNMNFMFKAIATLYGGMDKMLTPMYDRGLEKLDSVLVNDMKKYSIAINGIVDHGGGYYMYTTVACKQTELSAKMTELFPKVAAFMEQNAIPMHGMPFSLYQEWDEKNKTAIFSACIPVSEKIVTPVGSEILCGYIEPGKYFKTTLKGNYANLFEAWIKAEEGIKTQGLEANEGKFPFEVYANDPQEHPNPADWITEILIPVKESSEIQ